MPTSVRSKINKARSEIDFPRDARQTCACASNALKLGGIFWRGQRNAERVQVRHNYIRCQRLPRPFNGFTLLHISDLHVDMNEGAMRRLEELLPDLEYDTCVITGDYRGATFGPFADALDGMKRLRSHLGKTVYGVSGNHDTIRMVPGLGDMGNSHIAQ
jgi:uncharacterized protein